METDQPKAEIDNDALNKLWKEVTDVYPDRHRLTKEETYNIFGNDAKSGAWDKI